MSRFSLTFPALILVSAAAPLAAEPFALFDGKTFDHWEGDTGKVWRIEDGAFTAGSLEKKQEQNNFLATKQEHTNFDLTLKWRLEGTEGFVNGGVQFRSKRIPSHHEVVGYQADLGAGYDGALYDESRRRKMLAQPSEEVLKKAQKPLGVWNDYRIRAEGARIQIWLNGVQTVDYTEAEPGIERTGIIAVQIHGNATSVVQYKDIRIEVLEDDVDGDAAAMPLLKANDVIALAGASNMERTRFNGFLQTQLVASMPDAKLRVRNFGWEGDTVFEQWRDDGNLGQLDERRRAAEKRNKEATGADSWRQQRDWREQLADAGATVVIAQFGQMEALAGKAGIESFREAYKTLATDFAAEDRRLVLVSPMPFEKCLLKHAADLTEHNADVVTYAQVVRELAAETGAIFVDLSLLQPGEKPLTDNGWQLNEHGHRVVAEKIVTALGIAPKPEDELAAVRREVVELETLWFNFWRPMNWSFLAGDRTNVPYSRDWKDSSKRLFPQEMEDFLPLIQQADENIWSALAGKPVTPIGVRSSIPIEPPTAEPQSPEEELASFKILDGFKVNLFASEADGVVKPIQMRWDERGRLWVACALSYPQIKPGEKANDYVLVCEDTDGDGRADKFHKFVEGLFMPSGLELGDGGLYVAQGTELLHFTDTDGDDRADTRRIVLGGFGTADSHQMINCINWGFGGELWFTQGHHIYSRVETPYGVETLNRAGVWRFRPRTSHLDPFFQWSSAGANCWGVVTTDYGQPFHKSGANIGGYFSTPGLVRSNLAVDAQPMNLFLAPIKQVGLEFIGSEHFPEEWQGRAIIGGYYANLLEQHELTFSNGVYETKLMPNIIETSNNVFRPVEVRGGPDGALYVADWYNPIIGHYQASYRHPDRDKEHGRVWRVSRTDRPLVSPPKLAGLDVPGLLELVDSPERWVKYQVKRLLFSSDPDEVVAALDTWVTGLKPGDSKDEYRRLQALSLYEAHEAPRPDLLKSLLRSPDARVRAYATRTLSTWARDDRLPDALDLLEVQIADEDPLVRLEAIVACSYIADPRAAVVAARALDQDFNAYHQHALTKTLHATHFLWAPLLAKDKLSFDKDEHLIFALQNGWVENQSGALRATAQAAASDRPGRNGDATAMTGDAARIMRKQVLKHEGDEARQTRWLKALAGVSGPEALPFIFERGGRNPEVLAALSTGRPEEPAKWLGPRFEDANPAVRAQAVRLAGAWKVGAFTDRIRAMALEKGSPVALQAWIRLEPDAVAERVLGKIAGAGSAEEMASELRPLVSLSEGHGALVRALRKPNALSPGKAKLLLQAVNSLGKADNQLSSALMKLAGINEALPTYTKAYIANLVKAANTFGNAEEGKRIYEQTGCVACHMPGAPQSKIGPDLSAISRGMPIDMIITEVVWPALNVKEGYEAATVTMKDGTVVTGFRQTDTASVIGVRDLATGQVREINKSDTASIQLGGTVMPDGLTAGMNEQQLAHLIRYLSELGR